MTNIYTILKKYSDNFTFFTYKQLDGLLKTFSYLCLIILIIKCYQNINNIYIVIEYFFYGKILRFIISKNKNILTNLSNILINNKLIKHLLFSLIFIGLVYINFILLSSIVLSLTGLNFNLLLLDGLSVLNGSESQLDNSNNNNIFYSQNNNTPNNTNNASNTNNPNQPNNVLDYLRGVFNQREFRVTTVTNVASGEMS